MGLRLRFCAAFSIAILAMSTQVSSVVAVTYGNPIENPSVTFPEVVPIWSSGGMCSGTLIEQQVVLTAAHCIYGVNGPFQISVGGNDLLGGTRIDVDATWYHPRYDEVFAENDIGLLHLVKPAGVKKLGSLPKSNAPKPKAFTLLGWGRDQNGQLTGKLSKLKLTNYEAYTAKTYKSLYNAKTMIGAGRYFASEILYGGACYGDSGGPLYEGTTKRVIAGVTSWGSAEGCTSYSPSVFVRVSYHVKTLGSGIKTLKLRARQSPIKTGVPSTGYETTTTRPVTPTVATTTTTTQPVTPTVATTTTLPAPLVVGYKTTSQRSSWHNPGIRGTFSASANITKWCFALDGQALPDYRYVTGKGFSLNYENTPTQSGGSGCYEKFGIYSFKNSVDISGPSGIEAGRHSIVVTAYDALGRSAVSPTIYFNGAQTTSTSGSLWANEISTRTRTGEIEFKVYVNNSYSGYTYDSYVTKVCHSITRDGVEVINMRAGFWTLSEANCVTNPSSTFAYSNESSGVVDDPAGTQRWSVIATVYNSKGETITTDAYWFDS
jgi:V8-like Glu-specific endopeptidase